MTQEKPARATQPAPTGPGATPAHVAALEEALRVLIEAVVASQNSGSLMPVMEAITAARRLLDG